FNPLYMNREEIAGPVSMTILTLILLFIKFNNLTHITSLHLIIIFQKLIVLQDFLQHFKIYILVNSNIVRMKPKVKNFSFFSSISHLFFNSSNFQKIKSTF